MNSQGKLDIGVFCKMNSSAVNSIDNWVDICERHMQRKTRELQRNTGEADKLRIG